MNPVIDSVTPGPTVTANAGTKVTLTVVAHDDDNKSTKLTLIAVDDAGNKSAPSLVTFQWTDGVHLVATTDDGTPVSVNGMSVTVG